MLRRESKWMVITTEKRGQHGEIQIILASWDAANAFAEAFNERSENHGVRAIVVEMCDPKVQPEEPVDWVPCVKSTHLPHENIDGDRHSVGHVHEATILCNGPHERLLDITFTVDDRDGPLNQVIACHLWWLAQEFRSNAQMLHNKQALFPESVSGRLAVTIHDGDETKIVEIPDPRVEFCKQFNRIGGKATFISDGDLIGEYLVVVIDPDDEPRVIEAGINNCSAANIASGFNQGARRKGSREIAYAVELNYPKPTESKVEKVAEAEAAS